MADDESPEVQRLSLLDEDGEVQENMEPPQRKRRSFWQRLLRKKSADDDDDDKGPKEDDALLGSGLENYNDYNDDDPAALDGSQRSRLTTSYRSTSSNHGGNSSDDDDDDDNNLRPHSIRAGTGMDEYDNLNFLLLSSGDDEEEDEGGDDRQMLQNYYRSAPNLNYNSNVVTYNDNDDDDDSSGSDDGSEDSDDDDDGNRLKNLDPLPAPRRPGLGQRSYSMSSGFSDRPTNEDTFIDPNGRKQLVGRIEGFGNANKVPPELTSPRTFRDRLRSFTSRSGGMKKMAIGYDDDNNNASSRSLSWTESLENNVNDIVDAIVPDPVLEGYIDHSEPRPPPPTKKKKSSAPAPAVSASTVTRLGSFRRQEFDNDETYILFLECELQNTELELASWKRRVTELEREVANLRGDDTDDDSSKSDASADGDEAESEIEWQSEPVVEGVLIDVEGSEGNATEVTTNDTAKLAQTTESPNNKNDDESEIEWQTEPLKEGVLIDVEGAEESVSHSIVCEETSHARNISKEANIVVNGESHGDGQESDEEEDDGASSDEEEEDGNSPAEGLLIDIGESESTVPIGAHSENDEADHEVKVGLLLDMDGDAPASQDHPLPADGSGEANLLGLPDVPAVVASTELNSVTRSSLTGDLNSNESNDGETAESGSDSSSEDTDEEDDEDEEEDDSDHVSTEEVKEGILIDIHDGHEDKTNSSSIHSPTKETLIPVVSDEEGQQSTSDDDGDDEVADEDNSTAVVPEGDLLDLGGVSPPAIGISG